MKKLKVEACVDNLDDVLDLVNEELDQRNCQSYLRNQIDIAVEEIFVNIARYAYEPANGDAVICVMIIGEEIVIRFEDTGKPFNPLEQADPNLDKPPREREIGGVGIFMVKRLMDKVVYSYVDNKNVLILRKKLNI